MTDSDQLSKLRALAMEKGYQLSRSPTPDGWFLVNNLTRELVVTYRGKTQLSVEHAIEFLTTV